VKDSLQHTWTSYSNTLRNVIFKAHTRQWIEAIRIPILLVHGTNDRIAPIENVREGIASLAQVKLNEFEAEHDIIFTNSKEVSEAIGTFLDRHQSSQIRMIC
jgi:pimeloyl-ACP methyl ester carboxylesterase